MVVLLALAGGLIMGITEYCVLHKKEGAKSFFASVFRHLLLDSLLTFAVLTSVFKFEHFLVPDKYEPKDYALVLLTSLIIGAYFIVAGKIIRKYNKYDSSEDNKKSVTVVKIVSLILFALGLFFGLGSKFIKETWGTIGMDQFIINVLFSPTEGTDISIYYSAFEGVIFDAVLLVVLFSFLIFSKFSFKFKSFYIGDKLKRWCALLLAISVFCVSIAYSSTVVSYPDLFRIYCVKSDFIEHNYQDPLKTTISSPKQKRNLVFFYLESVENTYLSKDLGGNMETNLMPELAALANEGVVFSDNSGKFGGPIQISGTQWSLASMVNQSMGITLKAPKTMNAYNNGKTYIENGVALGDILKEQGYNQTVMIGAKASFGGLDVLYKSHGNYKVFDYSYAIENNYIPKDYYVFWGYEDDKLYEFAKEELTRLSKEGKPFNFTLENADTHAPKGYLSNNAPQPYNNQYSNAIAYSTSQVVEFVKWIQKQPFYENTTIVLVGDHLSMAPKYFDNMGDYKRTVFNLILNPDPNLKFDEAATKNRQYTTLDMFPTILTALGYNIEGNKLALGTNLFSGKQTLIEQYGAEKVDRELICYSEFYNKKLLNE